jgi:hypothetical protein
MQHKEGTRFFEAEGRPQLLITSHTQMLWAENFFIQGEHLIFVARLIDLKKKHRGNHDS